MKYLAACCTVKNEEAIINERMAFHRAAGIEHLILIDNGSTDRTAEIIKAFPDSESITYLDWSRPGSQTEMYETIAREYSDNFEWCAFIDADEFLYPTIDSDLRHTLSHFGCSAIGVHWHIYGSSGHITKPQGLVSSIYQQRAPDDFIFNRHVKSVVKLRAVRRAITSHIFDVDGAFIDEDGRELHRDPPYGYYEHMPVVHNKLRINHYHVRSRDEYKAKAMRGYFGVDDEKLQSSQEQFEMMFSLHDQNEIFDDSAKKYLKLMEYYLR